MAEGVVELNLVELDEPDLYARGWDEALAQVSAIVRQHLHAARTPDLRIALGSLLDDVSDLGVA